MNEIKTNAVASGATLSPCHPVTLSPCQFLIAGIGNIFLGDDAFGVEVVRRLAQRPLPPGVVVKDFGIRGFDLACALQETQETAILVDTIARDGPPGTLHVLELDPNAECAANAPRCEMHRLDPAQVLRLARVMGGSLPRLFLVGCVPASLEPVEDGSETLSEPLRCAIPAAIDLIGSLVARILTAPSPHWGDGRGEGKIVQSPSLPAPLPSGERGGIGTGIRSETHEQINRAGDR